MGCGPSSGCSDVSGDRAVLTSQWASSELWWVEPGEWRWSFDRPLGTLSGSDVLAKYGDEAFRRRDAMIRLDERWYRPRLAPLVGMRVSDALARAGWVAEADGPLEFSVRRGGESLQVVSIERGGRPIVVQGPRGGAEFTSIADLERWLLTEAGGEVELSGLDEIVSWTGVETKE